MKVCATMLLAAAPLLASGTAAWEMNTYSDFIRGRFRGVSLTRDGRLTLAPRLDTVFHSDQPVIWTMAQGPGSALYAGTGHRGRVFRVNGSGRSSVLWTADQPEVFALAVDKDGAVFAGSSPDGKVYRIAGGQASEYFDPKAKYIWSLSIGPDGTLYAGTGDQGKVFRITAAGKGEVWYETGQSHVISLAFDSQGRLLAGTEPNGVLYRITAKDKAFALYDANLPEVRAIVPAPDGSVYAAALGGSLAKRIQSASQAVQTGTAGAAVTATATSITVEAAQSADFKVQTDARQQQAAPTPQVTSQFSAAMDLSGVEKSAIYRIHPDNTVETLWSSKEENVYDLLALPDRLVFSTDGNGRVYSLTPDRKATLVAQTNEAETTRLLAAGSAVLAATGNLGRIYRLGDAGAAGTYESPVYDAGAVARWGALTWRGDVPSGAAIRFHTRSGNSARPDKSWSEWSEAVASSGARIASPNARYIQWRAELSGAASPALDSVTVAYLPQNSPPAVRNITVTNSASTTAAAAKPPAQQPTAAYTVTVTDTGEASAATTPGTPTTTLSRAVSPQINITWQAEDPDGDRLIYTLWFRGEEEREWKLLKANIRENTLAVDGDALADGRYFFRVMASDREVNPPGMARTAELVSAPVLIDNTPPSVVIGAAQRSAGAVTLNVEAADAASPLRRCEYSLDAAPWVPMEAADGVVDSQRESFILHLPDVPAGEHLLVVRAVDSANNSGLAKVVLR
ncbi:MAG: hypothetical protein ACE15B_11395 [Bryobacteraceae bacterium]